MYLIVVLTFCLCWVGVIISKPVPGGAGLGVWVRNGFLYVIGNIRGRFGG